MKTAENGFQYYQVDDGRDYSDCSIVSLKGDIIVSHCYSFYEFIPDSTYGGFFKCSNLWGNYIVGMHNNYIESDYYFKDFKRTASNKAYFTIFSKAGRLGICDLKGNIIMKPIKIKKNQNLEYDDSKNEFYLSKYAQNRKKYLGVRLPDLDYESIAAENMNAMKEKMRVDRKIIIKDKEVDGLFYKEITDGLYVGALDYKGNEIVPLDKECSLVEFISPGNGLGFFRVQKGEYIGVYDLTGHMTIPFEDKLDQITFYKVKDQENSGIPGFFRLEKGNTEEIRDLNGDKLIPFTHGYKFIRFHPIRGKIGYFEGEKNSTIYAHDMSGECFATSYNYISYDENIGFKNFNKNFKKVEVLGINLTKDGIADYSKREQLNAEKENNRRKRAQYWRNVANAFSQSLVQTAQVSIMFSQAHNNSVINNYVPNQNPQTGSMASKLEDPQYLNQTFNQIMNYSIAQVQFQELQEYNQVREGFQRMGKDLSLAEFRAMKGQSIMDLKEQGIDVIAEQNATNREMRAFYRSQMNSGKENVEKIKQQNAAKYGGTYSQSNISNYNGETSAKTSSSSTFYNTSYNTSTAIQANATANNSDSGNAYRYIQREVNLHENPNSNSSIVFQNCKVYQKGSLYFVKIGEEYYQIQHCNKQFFNYTVRYGSHPYFLNM
jgi:hypothetical protein